MGLGYVVTGILYRGLCPDALNDPVYNLWDEACNEFLYYQCVDIALFHFIFTLLV